MCRGCGWYGLDIYKYLSAVILCAHPCKIMYLQIFLPFQALIHLWLSFWRNNSILIPDLACASLVAILVSTRAVEASFHFTIELTCRSPKSISYPVERLRISGNLCPIEIHSGTWMSNKLTRRSPISKSDPVERRRISGNLHSITISSGTKTSNKITCRSPRSISHTVERLWFQVIFIRSKFVAGRAIS